ncbi:MAG: hypothetical protein JEZ14_11695 [Marinilabiliaceae bacterium]|nr:hypothetical protein [Marinilabiliaceae bacterium]
MTSVLTPKKVVRKGMESVLTGMKDLLTRMEGVLTRIEGVLTRMTSLLSRIKDVLTRMTKLLTTPAPLPQKKPRNSTFAENGYFFCLVMATLGRLTKT